MTVSMSIKSVAGTYTFPVNEMPLFSRRLAYVRQGDVGYGLRRRDLTLSGFFLRNSHVEIVDAYKSLIRILNANDARFTYTVSDANGAVTICDTQVYFDDYSEPEDWKEYDGTYQIAMHYYEKPVEGNDLGLNASYSSQAGNYVFDPAPNWSGGFKQQRADFRAPRKTVSEAPISSQSTVTLTGWLTDTNAAAMQTKVIDFVEAFSHDDGILTYGNWADTVRIIEVQIPTSFPRDYCPYAIVIGYDSEDIIEFTSTRRIGRIHLHPKIVENPFCGNYAKTYLPSGQEVSYNIKIRSKTVAAARTLLVNEAAALLIPGGTELPGGSELWDDMDTSVDLNFTKYYPQQVIANLEGT